MASSIISVSKYSNRYIPSIRPQRETSLAEFRKINQKSLNASEIKKTKKANCSNNYTIKTKTTPALKRHNIRKRHGIDRPKSSQRHETSNQAGKGILFAVTPSTFATSRSQDLKSTKKIRTRPKTAQDVNERRVSSTNSTFKKYKHPIHVDGHLPSTYKRYNLQGRRIDKDDQEFSKKPNLDSVFVDKNINPHDFEVADAVHFPDVGDYVRIKKENPSTGWIRVQPNEIGKVLDTGHASVKAIFPSGLGIPWMGEREDVEVLVLKSDIKNNVVGSQILQRLRGIPETRNRGRKDVGSFYGPGFYAARKRGGGMVRARIIPHKYIGSCGFVVPNYVVSVDAVNYNE
jgi:hypothetical protein